MAIAEAEARREERGGRTNKVLIFILVRLPIKYLLICTSVCKLWHLLITSSDFITTHFTTKHNTQLLLVRRFSERTITERYSLHLDNDALDAYAELEFPFRANRTNGYFRILNSCNGLLCLTDDVLANTDSAILWNPAVRKYVMLPEPNFICRTPGSHLSVLGFGYDHVTNDYKVVRMMYPLVPQCKNIEALSPMVELYKLSTGSWESISPPASSCIADRNSLQAFVNGAVHWLATRAGSEGEFQCAILSFSMLDEAFEEMMVPLSLANEKLVVNMSVTVIGGLLSLVPYKRYSFMPNQHNSIWVMKEYGVVESWTKVFTINDDLLGGSGRMLGIAKNPERLLMVTSNKELIFYDPKSHRSIHFGVTSVKDPVFVNSYLESLVLLDGDPARGTTVSY